MKGGSGHGDLGSRSARRRLTAVVAGLALLVVLGLVAPTQAGAGGPTTPDCLTSALSDDTLSVGVMSLNLERDTAWSHEFRLSSGDEQIVEHDLTAGTSQVVYTVPVSPATSVIAFSAETRKIAMVTSGPLGGANPDGGSDLAVLDVDGGVWTNVTNDPNGTFWVPGADGAYSGDGSALAFWSSGNLTGDNPDFMPQVFRWKAGNLLQLTDIPTGNAYFESRPGLDEDGSHVYFAATGDVVVGESEDDVGELYRWTGGSTELVTDGAGENAIGARRFQGDVYPYPPAVDQDGDTVAFAADGAFGGLNTDGFRNVFLGPDTFTNVTGFTDGNVGPNPLDLSDDGAVAVANGHPNLGSGIVRWDGDKTLLGTGSAFAAALLSDDTRVVYSGTRGLDGFNQGQIADADFNGTFLVDPCGVEDPTAPISVAAVGEPCQLRVTWADPADLGGTEVLEWRILVHRPSQPPFVEVVSDPGTRSHVIDHDVFPFTTYQVGIITRTEYGDSLESTPLAPAAPTSCTPTPTFWDVPFGHPFFDDIEWMADEGISTGYPDGSYRPDDAVTRAAMSAFMYRLAGSPTFPDPPAATFADVGTGHPFFTEIEWMADEGITTGFPGGLYKPGANVTRAAMSAFMHRLSDGPGVGI